MTEGTRIATYVREQGMCGAVDREETQVCILGPHHEGLHGWVRAKLPETVEQFVARYCDGLTPLAAQRDVIESFLANPAGQVLWLSGNGGGKTMAAWWLRKAIADVGGLPSDNPHLDVGRVADG